MHAYFVLNIDDPQRSDGVQNPSMSVVWGRKLTSKQMTTAEGELLLEGTKFQDNTEEENLSHTDRSAKAFGRRSQPSCGLMNSKTVTAERLFRCRKQSE